MDVIEENAEGMNNPDFMKEDEVYVFTLRHQNVPGPRIGKYLGKEGEGKYKFMLYTPRVFEGIYIVHTSPGEWLNEDEFENIKLATPDDMAGLDIPAIEARINEKRKQRNRENQMRAARRRGGKHRKTHRRGRKTHRKGRKTHRKH
jgi:hypothetical protein